MTARQLDSHGTPTATQTNPHSARSAYAVGGSWDVPASERRRLSAQATR